MVLLVFKGESSLSKTEDSGENGHLMFVLLDLLFNLPPFLYPGRLFSLDLSCCLTSG